VFLAHTHVALCTLFATADCLILQSEVRRAILDFTRKIGHTGAHKKLKIIAQMTKQGVMDLLDVCCVYVYVKDQMLRQFGNDVMEKIRDLWLKGLWCLDIVFILC
jgi:hypothetical protein